MHDMILPRFRCLPLAMRVSQYFAKVGKGVYLSGRGRVLKFFLKFVDTSCFLSNERVFIVYCYRVVQLRDADHRGNTTICQF